MQLNRLLLTTCLLVAFVISGCETVDLYEKRVTLDKQEWSSKNKLHFNFSITDTSSLYRVYLVLRHTEKYSFNNIYLDVSSKGPNSATTFHQREDVKLATDDQGWLTKTAMGDVYDHRHALGSLSFGRAGEYQFTLQQIMRQDPLEHLVDIGIRLEKVGSEEEL